MGLIAFVVAFVGINGAVEAVVCFLLGGAISKALLHVLPGQRTSVKGTTPTKE